eukprot:1007069-Prorocentrum_minimum.AAC.2
MRAETFSGARAALMDETVATSFLGGDKKHCAGGRQVRHETAECGEVYTGVSARGARPCFCSVSGPRAVGHGGARRHGGNRRQT